jgi:hypothetical protein
LPGFFESTGGPVVDGEPLPGGAENFGLSLSWLEPLLAGGDFGGSFGGAVYFGLPSLEDGGDDGLDELPLGGAVYFGLSPEDGLLLEPLEGLLDEEPDCPLL